MKFRKKPVVIEATQWFKNGDHPDDYAADEQGFENGKLRVFTGAERKANQWEGGVVRYFRRPDVPGDKLCEQCGQPHHIHGWVDTLEQGHRVCPGDWIITGVQGERYPCKPDIFSATYEAVLQPHQQRVVDEKAELDTKATALSNFIGTSPIFEKLDPTEQERLKEQNDVMWRYSEILAQRIAAF